MKVSITSLPLLFLAFGALTACQFVLGIGDDPSMEAENEPNLVQVQANDLGVADEFGSAVALDGTTVIVGASQEDPGGETNGGAAYIFIRNSDDSWEQQVKLVASDVSGDSFFGTSVAIDGNVAVVGAPGADNQSGAAYVFVRTGSIWSEQAKLVSSGRSFFGASVAIATVIGS
jgi:hypothetical protein